MDRNNEILDSRSTIELSFATNNNLNIQHLQPSRQHGSMPGSTPVETFLRQELSYNNFVIQHTIKELSRIRRSRSPPRWKDDATIYQESLTPIWRLTPMPSLLILRLRRYPSLVRAPKLKVGVNQELHQVDLQIYTKEVGSKVPSCVRVMVNRPGTIR